MRADEEFKKYVAIKLIREGRDSHDIIARFRRELQILAALNHLTWQNSWMAEPLWPKNIAKLRRIDNLKRLISHSASR